MVPTREKILNFGLCESLKIELSKTIYFPKLSLESWMLHCPETVENFTGKKLCWSFILITKKCRPQPTNFIKRETPASCPPVQLAKLLRTPLTPSVAASDCLREDCSVQSCLFVQWTFLVQLWRAVVAKSIKKIANHFSNFRKHFLSFCNHFSNFSKTF